MPGTAVHHVTRPFEIPSLWPGEEFALLLVVRAPDIVPDEQLAVSRQIVNAGCRYAVCTGVGSSSWDDSLDHAVVEADLGGLRDESRLVMTTWHDGEPLAQVVAFFLDHGAFEGFTPSHRLAVQLGGTDQERLALEALLHEAASGRPKR
jgi:hypothetical protein